MNDKDFENIFKGSWDPEELKNEHLTPEQWQDIHSFLNSRNKDLGVAIYKALSDSPIASKENLHKILDYNVKPNEFEDLNSVYDIKQAKLNVIKNLRNKGLLEWAINDAATPGKEKRVALKYLLRNLKEPELSDFLNKRNNSSDIDDYMMSGIIENPNFSPKHADQILSNNKKTEVLKKIWDWRVPSLTRNNKNVLLKGLAHSDNKIKQDILYSEDLKKHADSDIISSVLSNDHVPGALTKAVRLSKNKRDADLVASHILSNPESLESQSAFIEAAFNQNFNSRINELYEKHKNSSDFFKNFDRHIIANGLPDGKMNESLAKELSNHPESGPALKDSLLKNNNVDLNTASLDFLKRNPSTLIDLLNKGQGEIPKHIVDNIHKILPNNYISSLNKDFAKRASPELINNILNNADKPGKKDLIDILHNPDHALISKGLEDKNSGIARAWIKHAVGNPELELKAADDPNISNIDRLLEHDISPHTLNYIARSHKEPSIRFQAVMHKNADQKLIKDAIDGKIDLGRSTKSVLSGDNLIERAGTEKAENILSFITHPNIHPTDLFTLIDELEASNNEDRIRRNVGSILANKNLSFENLERLKKDYHAGDYSFFTHPAYLSKDFDEVLNKYAQSDGSGISPVGLIKTAEHLKKYNNIDPDSHRSDLLHNVNNDEILKYLSHIGSNKEAVKASSIVYKVMNSPELISKISDQIKQSENPGEGLGFLAAITSKDPVVLGKVFNLFKGNEDIVSRIARNRESPLEVINNIAESVEGDDVHVLDHLVQHPHINEKSLRHIQNISSMPSVKRLANEALVGFHNPEELDTIESHPAIEKLKHIKGYLESSPGPVLKTDLPEGFRNIPGDINKSKHITPEDIDRYIDKLPKEKFNYFEVKDIGTQRHSSDLQQGICLTTHPELIKKIKDAGLSGIFKHMSTLNSRPSHPGGDSGLPILGWVRFDASHNGHAHIDEIQSDLIGDMNKEKTELSKKLKDPKYAHEAPFHQKRIEDINKLDKLLSGNFKSYYHALSAAGHQYLREKGFDSTSFDMPKDQLKQSGDVSDVKIDNIYRKIPEELGYTEINKRDVMPDTDSKYHKMQYRKLVKSLNIVKELLKNGYIK